MMRYVPRGVVAFLGLWAACALSSGFAAETPSDKIAFQIDADLLTDALLQFTEQSKVQLAFSGPRPARLKAPKVVGNYTAREVLNRLLADSGFKYVFVNERTVAIRSAREEGSSSRTNAAGQMRLASEASGQEERQADSTDGKTGDNADVIVEGERDRPPPFSTGNLDLTRTEDDALPFIVFDAQEIRQSGAVNLEEFLRNRLTQNFSDTVSSETGAASNAVYDFGISMRGWDSTETVFLLNGRRMNRQYRTLYEEESRTTPNLNGIALASIERIEVLASAGSVIYGGSATGGVINIITRRDFKGARVTVAYESPADVHVPRRSVDLAWSAPWKWGTRLRLSANYSESEPLRAGDRSGVSIERWRQRVVEREPERVFSPAAIPPFGATPNIWGPFFGGLFGFGTEVFTTVPGGYTGGGDAGDFQPGVYNLELSEGSSGTGLYARESSYGRERADTVFSAGFDKDFGADWTASVGYRYAQNNSTGNPWTVYTSFSSAAQPMIPAATPSNPFGQDVIMAFIDPRLQRPELDISTRSITQEVNASVFGSIGRWRGYVDVTYSRNENRRTSELFYEPTGGWNAAFLSGAYDPFVDGRAVAPAADEFYENYVANSTVWLNAVRNYQSSVKVSGPAFALPAGDVELTLGVEWSRSHRYLSSFVSRFRDPVTGEPRIPTGATSDIDGQNAPISNRFVLSSYAGYGEATIPLLSARQALPLVHRFDAFMSGRLERAAHDGFRSDGQRVEYSRSPHVYAAGLRYQPMEGVLVRISDSIGFKVPSLSQITPTKPPPATNFISVVDPLRGNETRQLSGEQRISGGNIGLRPETTRSRNIGLILTPRGMPGMRVSVDYIESVRNDAIVGLGAQEAVDLEADLGGRIERGAPDGHPSGVGPIVFVDYRNTNFSEILSKSVDLSIEKRFEDVLGGHLTLTAAATRNLSFKIQTTNTAPSVEQVRNPQGGSSRQIAWNANGQIYLERGAWGVGWSMRYFDYLLVSPSNRNLQGSDRVPSAVNHDLQVNYRFGDGIAGGMGDIFSNVAVTFGVKNVFDRTPRFWAGSADFGVAPYDSIMGRSVWMNVSKSMR